MRQFARINAAMTVFLAVLSFVGITRAQERQVPFDRTGKMLTIDKSLEDSLQIFPRIENYSEARLFASSDTTFNVEITCDSSGYLTRIRIPWTATTRTTAQDKIAALIQTKKLAVYVDQDGRSLLIVGAMLISTIGYGSLLPYAFGMSDASQITGTVLLLGGSCFFITTALTSNSEVTDGEASLATAGGVLGGIHASLAYLLISADHGDGRTAAGIAVLGSLGEFVTNFEIAKSGKISGPSARVMTTASVFGGLNGLAVSVMILGSQNNGISDGNSNLRLTAGLLLAGSVGGYFAGDFLARDHQYEAGDATALGLAATLGGAIPLVNLPLAGVDDHILWPGISMLGSIGAMYAAHEATRHTRFMQSQGTMIALGTAAGVLLGTGVALIAKSDPQSGFLLGSAGALAGYIASFSIQAHAHQGYGDAQEESPSKFHIGVNPTGLVQAFNPQWAANDKTPVSPILNVSYHW